jgi:multidrug efflux pump
VSRFDIGLVISSGLGIGTLFTLYVVPAFYMLLAPEGVGMTQPTPAATIPAESGGLAS